MNNEKNDKKRVPLDPGNMLFVLYVGFILCCILLAMVVDGRAAVDRGDRGEHHLSEVRQGHERMVFAHDRFCSPDEWQYTPGRRVLD